uniref:C-type lectin domain-containing protein n=1 Tax=Pseudonaja textilis TaxID=8673 RepID=A0A670ZQG5_PSETE
MAQFIVVSFSLLVVALSLRDTGADHHCPRGWASYNEFCYMVYNRSVTWNNAERFCLQQETDCHLASIHSKPEAAFLVRLAYHRASAGSSVWIGLNDPEKVSPPFPRSSLSIYLDGSRRKDLGLSGDPNFSFAAPGYVGWNDQDCGSRHNFVCKFQPRIERNTVDVIKRK